MWNELCIMMFVVQSQGQKFSSEQYSDQIAKVFYVFG